YAAALVESLPPAVLEAAHQPYGARAIVYGLLVDRRPKIREKQLAALDRLAAPDVAALTKKLLPYLDVLDVRARLPLVDLATSSLRAMSPSQYKDFLRCFKE